MPDSQQINNMENIVIFISIKVFNFVHFSVVYEADCSKESQMKINCFNTTTWIFHTWSDKAFHSEYRPCQALSMDGHYVYSPFMVTKKRWLWSKWQLQIIFSLFVIFYFIIFEKISGFITLIKSSRKSKNWYNFWWSLEFGITKLNI